MVKTILPFDARWFVGLVSFILAQIWNYKTLAVEPLRDECGKEGMFKKIHKGMQF